MFEKFHNKILKKQNNQNNTKDPGQFLFHFKNLFCKTKDMEGLTFCGKETMALQQKKLNTESKVAQVGKTH